MPRCEDWEWDVDPCNCRLKACQLDATAIATQAANAVLAAQNAGQLGPLEAQQEIEVIFQALDVIYEQCALEADACNGREPRLQPSPLPSNDKASINKHKSDMDIGIAVAGGGAIFCGGAAAAFGAAVAGPAMFIVGLGYVAVGIGFVIAKRRLDDLAIDPPDSNWDTVVLPSPPQPPDIAPTADLSPGLAVAFNAMLENQALSLGVAGALTTSLDRASAAETAGSTAARDRQLEAARSYARQWAELLRPAGNLRTAVASAMRTEYPWMHGASITDLRVQRDEIWTNGWPQAVYEIAEAYTENSSERDLLLKEMSQRLGFISSFTSSPIDILEARNLGPHEQKTAQVLNRFAAAPRRRGSIGSVDPG